MIILHVEKIDSFIGKIKGLMFEKTPRGILFQTRFGIHTLGMRFPIDVVILNKQHLVADLRENLKPNNIFFWNPKYDIVLELPKGMIKKMKLKIGSEVQLA